MSTLQIERLRCRYRVPREHPNPSGVQSRMDRLVREGLIEGRWADAVATLVPDDEEGVLVIRRLDLKLLLGGGVPEDARLAALWRRGLAQALARALAAEPDGRWLMWFPSRAAYLARFVEDHVAGRAAGVWYYEPFRPLLGLPARSALREAFRREPALIVPTLALLDEHGRLAWLTALLDEADAAALLTAIPPAAGDSALRTDAALLAAIEVGRPQRWWSDRRAIVALHLLAAVSRADGGQAPSRSLLEAVEEVAALVPVLRQFVEEESGTPSRLLERIRGDEGTQRALEALRRDHPSVAAALIQAAAPVAAPAAPDGGERFGTAFGGVFLLLPSLAEMDLSGLLREAGFTEDDLAWAAPLGRWLVLVACLGPEHRTAARVDAALRLAAGLEHVPDRATLRRLARMTAPHATALGAALAAWAARARLLSGKPAVTDVARTPGRRWVMLERDGGTGLWLRARLLDRRGDAPPSERVASLPPAVGELAHVHLAGLLGNARAGLAWSEIAATLLNLFARKLPGFVGSSAGYLCRNFLAGTSLVECDARGVGVDLPRVPLQVVMRMAGAAGRYEIPWLPGGSLSIRHNEAYSE
jgi:hypothetical protein